MAWNPFNKADAPQGDDMPRRAAVTDDEVADETVVMPAQTEVPVEVVAPVEAVAEPVAPVEVAAEPVEAPAVPAAPPTSGLAAFGLGGATRVRVMTAATPSEIPVVEPPVAEALAAPAAEPMVAELVAAAPEAPLPFQPSDLYRVDDRVAPAEATVVLDDTVTAEQMRLEQERIARREARMAALAPMPEETVAMPVQQIVEVAAKPAKQKTDKFVGAFGLFLLRAAAAFVVGVHGVNGILNPEPLVKIWSNTVLPSPNLIVMGLAVAELVVALMLLFGFATRFAGFVLAALMGATLAFVMWGPWSIFEPGNMGFLGERELLVAAVGVAFIFVGAGGWSIDYGIRRSRESEKESRRA